MRKYPVLGRLSSICFVLGGMITASSAEAPRPAEKVAEWKISQPLNKFGQYTGFAVGLDGRVWASVLNYKEFLVFDRFRNFTVVSSGSFVPDLMTRGSDGDLYLTEGDTQILRVSPTGSMTTITLGQQAYNGISAGPDGSVWVPELSEVGRVFVDGTVREYPMLSGDMVEASTAITQAAGGDVWFDAYTPGYAHYLASMNPQSGTIRKHTAHACGTGNTTPIIAAPDGRVWVICGDFSSGYEMDGFGAGSIARAVWPRDLGFITVGGYDNAAVGPDNAIWIVGQNVVNGVVAGGAIVRFDLVARKVHKYLPPNTAYQWANGLTFDAHGNLWAGTGNGQIQELILR